MYGIFQKLKLAQRYVNDAKSAYQEHNKSFECVRLKTVCDGLNGGAHVTGKEKCEQYEICDNTACKHYAWKVEDDKLRQNLDTWIKVRNDLLVNYFWIFRKYRELKEYKAASELVKQKSRERLHNVCMNVYAFDGDASDAELAQQNRQDSQRLSEEYAAALAQCKVARAKFWGRKK